MMLSRKPGPCLQWAREVARIYSRRLHPSPADSKFMLSQGSACLPQTSAVLTSSLWTCTRSSRNSERAWHIRTQPNSLLHKGLPYSTSKQPGDTPRSTAAKPKKPLLNVLTKITPHENIYTIPNILTFSRLVAAPVVGYLVLHDHHAWAVGLFAYAGITDLVDGWIARRWNLQTVVGTVIDPMADKTLMTILTVCLAIKGALPVWLAVIILGRDVGLAITAIYYRWISLPPPKTFARYWDFSLPSAEVHPTTISKYNTALQLALIGATTAMPLVTVDVSAAMTAMQYLVATTTVWSGASYIYTKDAVKILTQEKGAKVEETTGKK
ncbi:phosphatidyl synthase [Cadophora sp. MPI-SDFR-AT-0126]|nr:phosphatidyl synthase [Leotiomycetes sp. MPI-SDFR-AT-0126]